MKIAVFVHLLCALFVFSVEAARLSPSYLVGKVIAFTESTVSVQSGNRIYDFPKKNLKFPSFKVGNEIEIPVTDELLQKIPSRAVLKKK